MKIIHKFQLEIGHQKIKMAESSQILCVKVQQGYPYLWVEVDLGNPNYTERFIEVYGTGQIFTTEMRTYIGTILLEKDTFVLHVYENHQP